MIGYQREDRSYPTLQEEVQEAVERLKAEIAKRKDLGPSEKSARFAEDMPTEPTIDDCFADSVFA